MNGANTILNILRVACILIAGFYCLVCAVAGRWDAVLTVGDLHSAYLSNETSEVAAERFEAVRKTYRQTFKRTVSGCVVLAILALIPYARRKKDTEQPDRAATQESAPSASPVER
jgi:hypothetical protein